MAKQITDDEDKLKRQARRRLIGAVVLTTVIVVVLPMVLDSEPKPVGQDIELRIPDKSKVGEFVPQNDLQPAAPVAVISASAVAAVSAPAVVSPPAPQAVVVPVPVVAPAVPEVKPAPAPVKPAAVVPEHKPEHKSEPVKHEAKPTEATRTEQGHPVPTSGFVVQIGAFANADTAHSWQKNLNQQGFKAYTEKLGSKTRVRIGPYPTREAATKARQKLEAKGLHANIVALD